METTRIDIFQQRTFRTQPGLRLRTPDEALKFIDARGFIFFWPVKDLRFPSLWSAVAGDRPVPNNHDDPGHITWRWKDDMLPHRRWYYGKLLRGKGTFVSLKTLPYFYALSNRVGDLDDFQAAYQAGTLSHEAYVIASLLLNEGPQNSIQLRRKAGLASPAAKYSFHRALTTLQRGLWILPVRVAQAGSWNYAFEYELFDRWFPAIRGGARHIKTTRARQQLLSLALQSLGRISFRTAKRLFGWPAPHLQNALASLEQTRAAIPCGNDEWHLPALHPDVHPRKEA